MTTPLLVVDDITKSYGQQQALCGVSLAVDAGELFGLLGPNGAGKSTLLSILSCLMDASGGTATLLGRQLNTHDREVRRLIGLVPQEVAIYNELTARENLHFFGELYGIKAPALEQRVESALAAVGLTDNGNSRASTFSGGMKRRLNFGAALIHEPRLLLLDEPTTGVDPQSRNHIFEEVRRLNQAGVTIIYTSHYMEEVEALCTRVGIIDHGRVIACDTVPGLLRQLPAVIKIRLARPAPGFRERLAQVNGLQLQDRDNQGLDIETADVKPVLSQLMTLMAEQRVDLASLEIQEPNLEGVFLHLTGRALRD
jgi:ABC-2 type transport system ATP-binding protein